MSFSTFFNENQVPTAILYNSLLNSHPAFLGSWKVYTMDQTQNYIYCSRQRKPTVFG